jgi:hypothetical protein
MLKENGAVWKLVSASGQAGGVGISTSRILFEPVVTALR